MSKTAKNRYIHDRIKECCDYGEEFTVSDLMHSIKIPDRRIVLTHGQLQNFLRSYDDIRMVSPNNGRAIYQRVKR